MDARSPDGSTSPGAFTFERIDRAYYGEQNMKKKRGTRNTSAKVSSLRKAAARKMPLKRTVHVRAYDPTADNGAWLAEMGQWLKGKFTNKDFAADPRLARIMGWKGPRGRKRKVSDGGARK